MNGIFSILFLSACLLFLLFNPDGFLPALLAGGEKAGTLALSLLAIYCVWLGFFAVLEQSGISQKFAKICSPLCKKLFRASDGQTVGYLAGNLSANLLGLPGAPTPLGVKAMEGLSARNNRYGMAMLFVLNATSLQLLPTTVLALRIQFGAGSPADILPATLIATAISSILGGIMVRLFVKR